MTLVTGKHLPRRTFLRGVGVTVALPFLDAFVPAGRGRARAAARSIADPTRLVCIENVHGAGRQHRVRCVAALLVAGGGRAGLRPDAERPEPPWSRSGTR